ncbi:MAG TPA: hypothetical protein VE135_28430 [Pyrinomonadaceae bacterium]|nr:hypothetical protein [Pyrinomonadaceae bacterium]
MRYSVKALPPAAVLRDVPAGGPHVTSCSNLPSELEAAKAQALAESPNL